MTMKHLNAEVGIVVIGRNEGPRLIECLNSINISECPIVYVDSGSTDGSVETATSMGAIVEQLDLTLPFTAARARNVGFARLTQRFPAHKFVQFVDGDCTLHPDWMNFGWKFLKKEPTFAAVTGLLTEKSPKQSIYNRLCEREWMRPSGMSNTFGGIVMMRIEAFRKVNGYLTQLSAGEEPELAIRILEGGWSIWNSKEVMGIHDANIRKFGQWWKRAARGGTAYIEIALLHSSSENPIWRFETIRAVLIGGVIPIAIVGTAFFAKFTLAFLLLYPIQVFRIAKRNGIRSLFSWQYAFFMTLAKFAEFHGIVNYYSRLLLKLRFLP